MDFAGPSNYIIRRLYLCGHPPEYVRVQKAANTKPPHVHHIIIPPPRSATNTVNPYRQTLERCRKCAEEHQAQAKLRTPHTRPRSLAAHQGQVQGGSDWEKDGFLHVLRRERCVSRVARQVRWKDEDPLHPGNHDYRLLKDLHEEVEAGQGLRLHAVIPYEGSIGRVRVEGPAWEGDGRKAYVVETRVSEVLAPGLVHEEYPASERSSLQPSTRSPHLQLSPRSPRQESPRSPRSAEGNAEVQEWLARTPGGHNRHGRQRSYTEPRDDNYDAAHHRALALRQLEGPVHMPAIDERHSEGTLVYERQSRVMPRAGSQPSNIPSYISHQRPFGPTRPSGGATFSDGAEPRGNAMHGRQTQRHSIMERLRASPLSGSLQDSPRQSITSSPRQRSSGTSVSLGSQGSPGRRTVESWGSVESFESGGSGPFAAREQLESSTPDRSVRVTQWPRGVGGEESGGWI